MLDLIKWMIYNTDMDTFSALADPTRRQILELLAREGPTSATEIAERFPISPPAISQHLKVLREAHLVHMDKRAQQRIYQLEPGAFLELEGWARRMTQLWTQRFDAFEKVLEAEKKKIEPDESEGEKQ
jgi:DNA-binding transcriptional ArsR family regulator